MNDSNVPILKHLPVLPLKRTVLFPGTMMPLTVGRDRSIAAVEAALKTEDKTLLVVAQRDAQTDQPTQEDLYPIGTKAIIKQTARTPDGHYNILIQGLERFVLLKLDQVDPYLQARVKQLAPPSEQSTEVEALHRAILDIITELPKLIQTPGVHEAVAALGTEEDPVVLAYRIASLLNLTLDGEQQLLAASTRADLLRGLYAALSREIQILQLRDKITSEAREKLGKTQREYLLREQLKTIQQELGEGNGEEDEVGALRTKIQEANLPEQVRKETDRELARLAKTPSASPEHQVIRSYLELVLELPWNKSSEEGLDLAHVRKVLNEDHYGIKEVKERIVEHLAVLKLNPSAKAPILCLVGPPGVGKTSLGQSIAKSMGRTFERFSLGGLHDEGELRGHRRTYVGALPGRIIQAVRRAGVNNPVIMLDEVDKLGHDFRGDPAAALLEILDPAQNHTFRDHYLDLPFDLSKVFFITTANTLETLSQPLLDRMEIIRLNGYSEREKREIALRYLWPRRLKEAGLRAEEVNLPESVLDQIIGRYTRESGVRQLEQMLGRITRKVAVTFADRSADAPTSPVDITQPLLDEWLGQERFQPEEARKNLPAGVATGLAWTPTGGDVLYIETTLLPGSHELTLTGQLGDVMQESARAARSYLWSHAESMGLDISRFKRNGVHIHVPSGAIPKDGPSAGITMATALASAYVGKPVRSDTAMTGEISLTGLVLPVGGIKEKVLAAHRAGIRRIILPKANEKDLKEVPQEVRDELTVIPVERIEQVLPAAFNQDTPPSPERGEPLATSTAS
ncbi:MAG: endopeptidase La [Nitrospira sp.]|nr:endopeptidase La [Nitrospira sp.]MBP8116284.1 endopeptidase La [Nitrospira sp.]